MKFFFCPLGYLKRIVPVLFLVKDFIPVSWIVLKSQRYQQASDLCILDNNRFIFHANLMPSMEKEQIVLYAFQVIVDLHYPLNIAIVIFCVSI